MTVHDLIGLLTGVGIGGGIAFVLYCLWKCLKWLIEVIW